MSGSDTWRATCVSFCFLPECVTNETLAGRPMFTPTLKLLLNNLIASNVNSLEIRLIFPLLSVCFSLKAQRKKSINLSIWNQGIRISDLTLMVPFFFQLLDRKLFHQKRIGAKGEARNALNDYMWVVWQHWIIHAYLIAVYEGFIERWRIKGGGATLGGWSSHSKKVE